VLMELRAWFLPFTNFRPSILSIVIGRRRLGCDMMQASGGDGKRELEDRTQPDWSERNQFLCLCLTGSSFVAPPYSQRQRRAFSLSVEFDGRNGCLCGASYCDLRAPVEKPA
jgi:hypothetical protein